MPFIQAYLPDDLAKPPAVGVLPSPLPIIIRQGIVLVAYCLISLRRDNAEDGL